MKENLKKYLSSFSGCIGGNLDAPIWICGIEFGGKVDIPVVLEDIDRDHSKPNKGYYTGNPNSKFDEGLTKILSIIEDNKENENLFTKLDDKHFRMNLYPLPYPSVKSTDDYMDILGLHKQTYYDLCENIRFPFLNNIYKTYKPKILLCFGTTFAEKFMSAFKNDDYIIYKKNVNNKKIILYTNYENAIIICPFLRSRSGLNSDFEINTFGNEIKNIIRMIDGKLPNKLNNIVIKEKVMSL